MGGPPPTSSMPIGQNALPISQQFSIPQLANPQQISSPFLAIAQPGQPTVPAQQNLQDLYSTLKNNYYQPLNTQLNLSAPPLDDPTTQALANQILATANKNSVGNGSQPPSPQSVIAKASQHLTAGEIAAEVGKETIQQMIMEPFHQLVDTWQRDPKMGLLETLGGAAVIGGIAALSGTALGAAAVFSVGAAIVMPGMVNSWLEELQHPTDSNLVKALVNTSTGVLTIGTPGRAFGGLGTLRRGLELDFRAFRNTIEPRGVAKNWVTGIRGTLADLRNVDAGKQMEVLGNISSVARRQFKTFGISDHEMTEPGEYLLVLDRLEGLQTATLKAYEAGNETAALKFDQEYRDLATGRYRELRQALTYNHRFLSDRPFSHLETWGKVPRAEISDKDWAEINKYLGTVMGKLDFLVSGTGLANQETLPDVAAIVEHQALSLSDGHPEFTSNEISLAMSRIAEILGIHDTRANPEELAKSMDWSVLPDEEKAWREASPWQQIEFGLEDPKRWEHLTPKQKMMGQVRAQHINGLGIAQLKAGILPALAKGGVRRIQTSVNPEEGLESLVRDPTRPMKGKIPNFSRVYQLAFDEQGAPTFSEKRNRWQQYLDERRRTQTYSPEFQDFWKEHGTYINAERHRLGGLKGQLSYREHLRDEMPARTKIGRRKQQETVDGIQAKLDSAAERIARELRAEGHTEESLTKIIDHILRSEADMKALKNALPLGRQLMTGMQLVKTETAAAVYRLHAAEYAKLYASHAETSAKVISENVLDSRQMDDMTNLLQTQTFVDRIGGKPNFLPLTMFKGGGKGSAEAKANAAQYFQVTPQIGTEGDLHYRPAIYAHQNIAAQIQHAYDNSYSSSQLHTSVMGALYRGVSKTKHVIMLSPAWHYMNVAGRVLGFVMNDPVLAIPALQSLRKDWGGTEKILMDSRLRAQLSAEFTANGGKAANTFNVSRALHHLDHGDTAQSRWPSAIRTPAGALWHGYEKHVEDGFWKMVDDFQLAAYQYAKFSLKRNPGIPAEEIPKLAALYANDLGGMVNPVYMNKIYKELRNLVWFAPSYWATFMRSMMSVMPGADRLSSFFADYRGGEFVRFGAVPLKAVSDIGRRELVRMHRSWMITYLATAVTMADLLNVMLGGRHLWENDEGHKFDINVDKAASIFGQGPEQKGAATKHAYFSGMPMFRQAMDVANALGLGHDYGFGHQFGDQNWQQADALHKALLLGGGLLQGIEQQAASKTSAPIQAGYGLLSGETLSGRAKGVQRQIGGPFGRLDALSSFIPGGSAMESALTQDQPLLQAAQSWGGSLLQQYTGLPSIYHLGIEQPPVDDSKMKSWNDQRTQIQDSLKAASAQMFAGQIQPIQYERLRQQSVDKLLQLDTDTFGNSTPVGALSQARLELEQTNGLNRNDLTDSQWAERNDLFQMEWDQLLQGASPETRAAWWEAETSQWTDADYLVWEAQQMRQALMGAIDGQGGQHIRAYQHMIGPLLDIPSTAIRQQLEQGDPYYYTYRQVLKQMATTSSLGAFINAFVSPYANMMIEPENLTPAQEQALANEVNTSATLIRPQTARALAAEAKVRAQSQAVEQSGGKAQADPGFDTEMAGLIQEAEAQANA